MEGFASANRLPSAASEKAQYSTYVEYGRRLKKLIAEIRKELASERGAKKEKVPVS